MGARKKEMADRLKEAKKTTYLAKLVDCPTSPRKMRLVADLVRGVQVDKALHILKFNAKEAAPRLEKLLLSAISNWQAKNEGQKVEDNNRFVNEIFVDSGRRMLRIRTTTQGRAHRIRKRSNHVTLILATKKEETANQTITQ